MNSTSVYSPSEFQELDCDIIYIAFLAVPRRVLNCDDLSWKMSVKLCFSSEIVGFHFASSPPPLHHNKICRNILFPLYELFKNSDFVIDEFLRIIENSQQVHEQLLIILLKFFRIFIHFFRIFNVVLKNSCMISWRRGSRTNYELSEFIRTCILHLRSSTCCYLMQADVV